MKNNENSDAIQKENRKNWLKFAVTLVVCALGGAVLGYGAAWFSDNVSLDALADSAGRVAGACAPFAVLAAALFLIPAVICLRRGQALFARWDGEEEETPELADSIPSWSLLWLTAAQLGGFLLFGVAASLAPLGYADPMALLPAAGEMLFLTLSIIALQRRVVDLTRRFNPEKQGSVYDFKFQKKWLASCDEAERQRIGQAAYSSFLVSSRTSMIVWIAMVLVNLYLPIGPLPVLAALIPWGVGQISYLAACLKMERSHAAPSKE